MSLKPSFATSPEAAFILEIEIKFHASREAG
jgi:hypothetical protein